jgi:putative ABC transport system ATP-binding protein
MNALEQYLAELIQRRLFARTAENLARRLPLVQARAWDDVDATRMVNRFFEVVTIQKVVSILLLDGISIILTAFIGMVVLAFYHPILLAFDIGILLSTLLLLFGWGRRGIRTAVEESVAKHAVAGWLQEVARDEEAFRSHSGGKLAYDVAGALTLRYLEARSNHFRVVFRQSIGGLVLQVAAVVSMLGIGGWLVLVGQMTLGQLVAAELIIAVVTGSLAKVGKYLETFYDLMASVDKLAGLNALPLDRNDGEVPTGEPVGVTVRVQSLAISSAAARKSIVQGLDVSVPAGGSAAIVGGEGSGKTLLAETLSARRSFDEGIIEVDGVDLRRWYPHRFRDITACVGNYGIIQATIFDNVQLGRSSISADEVRQALAAVELLDEANRLADGLETRLSEHGKPLSSGQARRLLLARALAGRPRFLILDGVLDAVDADSRRRIWDRIRSEYRATVLLLTANETLTPWCDAVVRLTCDDGHAITG